MEKGEKNNFELPKKLSLNICFHQNNKSHFFRARQVLTSVPDNFKKQFRKF